MANFSQLQIEFIHLYIDRMCSEPTINNINNVQYISAMNKNI